MQGRLLGDSHPDVTITLNLSRQTAGKPRRKTGIRAVLKAVLPYNAKCWPTTIRHP